MPVDDQGNRAHIIMDDLSLINRMIPGSAYEQYVNASSRDYAKKLCAILGTEPPEINGPRLGGRKVNQAMRLKVEDLVNKGDEQVMQWWEGYLELTRIINPDQTLFYVGMDNKAIASQLLDIVEDGIYHFHPTEADPELPDMLRQLRDKFPAFKSPLTYISEDGAVVRTKSPILVGSVFVLMLEKTGDDWNAVSSGRLQSYGVLSQLNNQDKYSSPWRQQTVRAWGETETSITTSYIGWLPVAVIYDRNNNITTHRTAVKNVLASQVPTSIKNLTGLRGIEVEGAKPLQLVNHLAMCNGWKFTYAPYVEKDPKPQALKFAN